MPPYIPNKGLLHFHASKPSNAKARSGLALCLATPCECHWPLWRQSAEMRSLHRSSFAATSCFGCQCRQARRLQGLGGSVMKPCKVGFRLTCWLVYRAPKQRNGPWARGHAARLHGSLGWGLAGCLNTPYISISTCLFKGAGWKELFSPISLWPLERPANPKFVPSSKRALTNPDRPWAAYHICSLVEPQ